MKLLKKYNRTLKASSLIESVIAMTVMAVCILIAMTLYTAVLRNSASFSNYKMEALTAQILNKQLVEDIELGKETYDFENFKIEKEISLFEDQKLFLLKLKSISKAGDTLITQHLIPFNDEVD